jgi:hypothetical protein
MRTAAPETLQPTKRKHKMNATPFSISESAAEILSIARRNAAEALVGGYGALRGFARDMSYAFANASIAWYTIEAKDTGHFAQLVHAEKEALFAALHAAVQAKYIAENPTASKETVAKQKYSNPSTIWARARKYAAESDPQAQNKGVVEGEGEGETGQTQERRSLLLRTIEECTTLWKAYERESQFLDEAAKSRQLKLVELLEACGIKRDALKV